MLATLSTYQQNPIFSPIQSQTSEVLKKSDISFDVFETSNPMGSYMAKLKKISSNFFDFGGYFSTKPSSNVECF